MGFQMEYTGTVETAGNRIRLITSDPDFNEPNELVPVRWGQRRYLINAEMVAGFCDSIKQGWEPRDSVIGGPYYLRKGDWDRYAIGRPISLDGLLLCP